MNGPSHIVDPMGRSRFPVDEWRLVETRFGSEDLGTTESLFNKVGAVLACAVVQHWGSATPISLLCTPPLPAAL